MFDLSHARDLVVTAVIFGFAAFAWAGWAQERPPSGWGWRLVLAALGAAGLVLVAVGIPVAIRHWNTPTAIDFRSAAFTWYVVVFWVEVIAIVVLAIVLSRQHRGELIAPVVLVIVGVHFVPLTFVFQQPIIMLTALLVLAAGVAALFGSREVAAPSFWAGILAAPVFLALGAISLTAAMRSLA